MSSEHTSSDATDIFSLSDRVLAEKLQFVKEIGFGNWGSVWLCRPRVSDGANDTKLAVKLVHRSKTTTTAARVRSLWNEMKVVRTFKNDPHPSIVPFHSFIITPSYALITMEYLPELVPVEVPEHRAKEWFRSLLSGVQFLHSRGVVHNDIKPANILLSEKQVPVLVDFGFAEENDLQSTKAFCSNLTYGTPEYLSPERARGLAHDTRKADIWALGVTFFEILVGRTPFEHTEGEQFATKAALEDYWSRTMRGKWLGSWKMSKGTEKMLHRMIQPNADVRCTAAEALSDPYWDASLPVPKKTASSGTPDKSKPRNVTSAKSSRQVSKGQAPERKRAERRDEDKENTPVTTPNVKKNPVRQRVLSGSGVLGLAKRRPDVNSHMLTPLRQKENVSALKKRSPQVQEKENTPVQQRAALRKQPTSRSITRKPSALGDCTVQTRNAENSRVGPLDKSVGEADKSTGSVHNRMREWELERARLREMERVGESDNQQEEERPVPVRKPSRLRDTASSARESPSSFCPVTTISTDTLPSPIRSHDPFPRSMSAKLFQSIKESTAPPTSMRPLPDEAESPMREPIARNASANESSLSLFKQSLKVPIGKTVEIYKSSIGLIGRRQSAANSSPPQDLSERPSWEREILDEANSSLPAVQQAVRNRRVGADSRADRMTIWLQNVEKVVADARQNFGSSNISLLPPLPVAPGPQTRRPSRDHSHENSYNSTRLSRKAVAANQVFHPEEDSSADQSGLSLGTTAQDSSQVALTDASPDVLPRSAFSFDSPRPTRRATVLGRSPEKSRSLDIDVDMTPSKRREKSKSANDLKRLIRPISKVQLELDQLAANSMSLSTVLDRNLFTPDPIPVDPDTSGSSSDHMSPQSPDRDSLTDSPFVVQPYPTRKQLVRSPAMDSPTQRHVEVVYDRFLMATSGVKRVGRGYQSCHVKPVSTGVPSSSYSSSRSPGKFFHSTRRPMPPPVSSEDRFAAGSSVDELGRIRHGSVGAADMSGFREDRAGAAKVVSRALKALVTGKTVVKKTSTHG